MGKLTSLLALCLVLSANALWAGEPDEASAKGDTAESTLKKKATSTPDGDSYKKFRFGGYGEIRTIIVIRLLSRVLYWHSIISSIPNGYWELK